MEKSNLGARMKQYEDVNKTRLINKLPVVIRFDGCHFHTFTRGMGKPFDDVLINVMAKTLESLCKEIPGCVLGYTQSDEMTLVLVDYDRLETQPWFGNVLRKIESVGGALATRNFNHIYREEIESLKDSDNYSLYKSRIDKAIFDCRAFNVPIFEVENELIWRQQDCIRNSINLFGQSYFSHRQLQGKKCNQVKEMLLKEKGIDWDKAPVYMQRGICCIKESVCIADGVERMKWKIDKNIPLFTNNKEYIRKRISYNT